MKPHYPNCQLGDQCNCDDIDELPDDYEPPQSREDAESERGDREYQLRKDIEE